MLTFCCIYVTIILCKILYNAQKFELLNRYKKIFLKQNGGQ